jgi:hypothetical protein
MDGKGIKVLLNGSIFEGTFDCDKLVGYGRAIFYDGSLYIGQWGSNGLPHGQGDYTTEEGLLVGTQWYNYINIDQRNRQSTFGRSLREGIGSRNKAKKVDEWLEFLKKRKVNLQMERPFISHIKETLGQTMQT